MRASGVLAAWAWLGMASAWIPCSFRANPPPPPPTDPKATRVVERIVEDLMGRAGLGNVWDEIDEEMQQEIEKSWAKIVEECT